MGSARIETIVDYVRLHVDVAIRCLGCRRTRNMTADEMAAVFGLPTRIVTAERRLRCSKCGHKGAKLAPIPRLSG
jgi:hypothetical protein